MTLKGRLLCRPCVEICGANHFIRNETVEGGQVMRTCESCHFSCASCSGPSVTDCLQCPQSSFLGNCVLLNYCRATTIKRSVYVHSPNPNDKISDRRRTLEREGCEPVIFAELSISVTPTSENGQCKDDGRGFSLESDELGMFLENTENRESPLQYAVDQGRQNKRN